MKKAFFIVVFVLVSFFAFFPVCAGAKTISEPIVFATKTSIQDWTTDITDFNKDYGKDQNCTGKDSILGDPNDEDSVAWLLDKILTYVTIIGMVIVVVLSSIDFLKVIAKSDDEEMAKATKRLIIRLLLAALLFFVPTITNAMLDIFGLTSESTCGIHQG